MNTTTPISTNNSLVAYTEQAEPAPTVEQHGPTIGFFAVGAVINIVMLAAFLFWAYKQWGKSGKRDE